MLHIEPSQCSISDWFVRQLETHRSPTAHTSLLARAASPRRMLATPPVLGLGTMLQLLPFQCSNNTCQEVQLGSPQLFPAAHASLPARALTERRLLLYASMLGLAT